MKEVGAFGVSVKCTDGTYYRCDVRRVRFDPATNQATVDGRTLCDSDTQIFREIHEARQRSKDYDAQFQVTKE